jgi:hypothetical protein
MAASSWLFASGKIFLNFSLQPGINPQPPRHQSRKWSETPLEESVISLLGA